MSLEHKVKTLQVIAAELADAVAELAEEVMPPNSRLDVPWIGQNTSRTDDDYTKNDCGAAVVAMEVGYCGRIVTVDEVSIATGKPRDYKSLSFDDLIKAAATFGLNLQHVSLNFADICAEVDSRHPVIFFVKYKSLPAACRSDARYSGGHYLLVVGYNDVGVIYHDPYWPDERGAYRMLTRDEFLVAYTTTAPGNKYASHALRMI